MLHDFLEKYRSEILVLCEEKTKDLAGLRGGSELLSVGLPLFYDQLISVLELKLSAKPSSLMLADAAAHGKEFLRLGYSLSHVVHSYGAMCQAITELAVKKNAAISSQNFNILNASLDAAIAAAVSEYQFTSNQEIEDREVQHLGFLAHELRNALSSAIVAQDMIKGGLVGTSGSTAAILEANLTRMRVLIDRSLTEVRLRADADLVVEKIRLFDLFEQIAITARIDAAKKKQILNIKVELTIEIESDRQLLLSSVANLIQNAIKYTKRLGVIELRARIELDRVVIEIEDQCGGIDIAQSNLKSLFEPFIQENEDKTGLGLGLAITKKAIQLCQGVISIENKAGTGCIFAINLPQKLFPGPSVKATVRGKDAAQPSFGKK